MDPHRQPTRWFLVLLLSYLAVHALIRSLLPYSLEYDEAEQLIHVQSLEWGYFAQPPLYTWLLWPLVQSFGANVFALLALKFVLLGLLYLLLHRTAFEFGLRGWAAVGAAFSPLLLPVFAWEAVRMMTHTVLLCVFCLLTLLVLLRVQRRHRLVDFVLLGLCLGFGSLAKYNYVVFAVCLFLAALGEPAFRSRLWDRRLLLSLSLALALAFPHVWWLAGHLGEVEAYLRFQGGSLGEASHRPVLVQVARMLVQQVAGVIPLLAALGLCLGWTRFRGEPVAGAPPAGCERRLLGWFLLASLVVVPAVMAASGLRHLRMHWLAPWMLLIPVGWIGALKQAPSPQRWRVYLGTVGAVTVALLVVRGAALWTRPAPGMSQTRDLLHALLARELTERGLTPDTILAPDPVQGGYQRLYFPHARVHCMGYGTHPLPAEVRRGVVVALWHPFGSWRAPWTEDLLAAFTLSPEKAIHLVESPPGVKTRGSVRQLAWVAAGTENPPVTRTGALPAPRSGPRSRNW